MTASARRTRSSTSGASLVGVLMIVVILGGLMALGIFGVSSLTGNDDTIKAAGIGTTPTTNARGVPGPTAVNNGGGGNGVMTACAASADAARAASAAYYANNGGAYPVKWSDLTASVPPNFALSTGVAINPGNPAELTGKGWTLTMTGGGPTDPSFACTPAQ